MRGLFCAAGWKTSVHPRRSSGVVVRPLNFTVWRHYASITTFAPYSLVPWCNAHLHD